MVRTLVDNGYSFDTCAIIDLRQRYPPDIFNGLWQRIEVLLRTRRMGCTEQVLKELEKKDDDAYKWAKSKRSDIFEPVAEHWAQALAVTKKHPHLIDINRTTPQADPFVVAFAKSRRWTVVTSEKGRSARSIPRVCESEGVDCLDLVGLFRRESWKFG